MTNDPCERNCAVLLGLQQLNMKGLIALGAGDLFKADPVASIQDAIAFAGNGGEVNKHFLPVFSFNEAEALLG